MLLFFCSTLTSASRDESESSGWRQQRVWRRTKECCWFYCHVSCLTRFINLVPTYTIQSVFFLSCRSSVDMEKQAFTVMSPSPRPLPRSVLLLMEDLTFMEVSWGDVIDLRGCIYLIVCSEAVQSRTLSYVDNDWEFLVNDTLVLRVLNELLLSLIGRIFTLNNRTAQFVVLCTW